MDFKVLIDRALREGFADVEISTRVNKSLSVSIFNGQIDKNQMSNLTVYSVRGIYNGKMSYVTFEDPNESLEFVIKSLKDNANVLTTDEEFEIFGGSKHYESKVKKTSNFYEISPQVKVEMLTKLEELVKGKDARIVHVPYCQYNEFETTSSIFNSKGLDLSQTNRAAYIIVGAVAKEGEDSKSAFEVDVVNLFEDFDIEVLAEKVASKALDLLGAEPVASKSYPVIFENEVMSSILAAFQSVFSGEAAIKKMTLLLGKEKEQIMSEKITISDDPFRDEAKIINNFDDEGVACYAKKVVEKGVFTQFLHNLKTAKYFKTTSTGNGFKQGTYTGVSGTNLFIEPGDAAKEDMISSTKEGLLITQVAGLHSGLDPISGNFSIQATGFLIEEGKVSRPVNLIVVSGNFLKMMSDVDQVGSDLKIDYSGVGAPSMKFASLNVSGK